MDSLGLHRGSYDDGPALMNEELALKAKAASAKATLLTSRLVAAEHAQAQHRHDEAQQDGYYPHHYVPTERERKMGHEEEYYIENASGATIKSFRTEAELKRWLKANRNDARGVSHTFEGRLRKANAAAGKPASNRSEAEIRAEMKSLEEEGRRLKDSKGAFPKHIIKKLDRLLIELNTNQIANRKDALGTDELEKLKAELANRQYDLHFAKTEVDRQRALSKVRQTIKKIEGHRRSDASGPDAKDLAQQIKAAKLKPHQERELLSKLRAANDPFEVRAVANAFKRASRQDAIPTTLMTLAKKCAEDGDSLTEFVKKAINARMLDHARPLSENVGIAKPYYERAARGDRQDDGESLVALHYKAKELYRTWQTHGNRAILEKFKAAETAYKAAGGKKSFSRQDTTYDTRTPAGVRTLHKKVLSRTRPIEGTKATTLMRQDSDAGHKSKRMFPAYTTAELKARLGAKDLPSETRTKMEAEVKAREAGTSVHFKVPQVGPVRVKP